MSSIDTRSRLASLPRPLVFTNGCFDILHRGHVDYLEQASALGKALVVGINSDESVRRLGKGDDRPLNTQDDRAAILSALRCVDLVLMFSEDTPQQLIEIVEPDILVKGGDWPEEKIVGAKWVKERGGSVHSIDFRFQRSTTALVEKIRGT